MKNKLLITTLLLSTISMAQQDATVLTVDGQSVSRGEFEAIYKKNNKDADVNKEALDEYMELFINYKLKVREAESLGMDTIKKFQTELAGYRTQLARPYLIDRELNESLLREAYERRKQEVRASHILIQIPGDQTAVDTTEAWKKVMQIRERVVSKGEDFATVAKAESDDPSAKSNGGDLGYFTALQMVYPFENMAFGTATGEVSNPVRTRFGYHLLKVVDKRPAQGEIKAAHIMVRSVETDSEDRKADATKRINEVYALIQAGKDDFGDLALKFSEDPGSSANGGELPQFGTGKMVSEFEKAAFALKNDGDVSKPFRTEYGWHIVKRISYKPVAPFDEIKAELKTKIAKDTRADITKKSFINKLKKEYGYEAYVKNREKLVKKGFVTTDLFTKGASENDTVVRANANLGTVTLGGNGYDRSLNGVIKNGVLVNVRSRQYSDLAESVDDTVVVRQINRGWSYDRAKASKLKKALFSLNGKAYTQKQFLDFLEKNQKNGTAPAGAWQNEYANTKFDEWVDEEVIAYENGQLEKKYDEFRLLMKEYRDGILLFELTDQKVWSKAVNDSLGLTAFHEERKNQFMWDKRWKVTTYKCGDEAIAKQTRRLLGAGKTQAEVLEQVNSSSSLALSVETGTYTEKERTYLAQVNEKGLSKNLNVDGQVVFVDVEEILAPQHKELDEARGMITAAYQDHLEAAWIAELRGKYKYAVNSDVLYSIK